MIYCKDLDKSFATKQELFVALKEGKQEVRAIKKATVKMTDGVPMARVLKSKDNTSKSLKPATEIKYGDTVYPVINTTLYRDSHKDLHLNGIWNKSAKEQTRKTYLLINHDLSIGKVISQPKDVEILIKTMPWKDLGKDLEGETEALIFASKLTEKSNKDGYLAYKDNDPVEHSIRMQYVKMELAINSDEEDFREEKAEWDKHFDSIANKDETLEDGYFWAVYEAKIYKEGSMVLAGSNDATPTLYDIEPLKDTQTIAAAKALLQSKEFLINLNS